MKTTNQDGETVFFSEGQCTVEQAEFGYNRFRELAGRLGRYPSQAELQAHPMFAHRLTEHMYVHYVSLADHEMAYYVPFGPWENGGRELVEGDDPAKILKRLLRRAGMRID